MTASDSIASPPPPRRRINWLQLLLIGSLALNLLFIGGAVARFVTHGPHERMSGMSQMQLIPRKFFDELSRARRRELLVVFKNFSKEFGDGRKAARDEVMNLANALEAEPYDPARVKAIVDAFSERSSHLVRTGGEAALTVIGKLSPEERKLLSRQIRHRNEGGRRKDRKIGRE
jgi:uncharacterized membrane protein